LQNISHELKTPLTVIINYALDTLNELRKEPLNVPEMEFDQGRIKSEGERLKRMVSQLLDVTAIESGKVKIQREPLSLAALLSRAADANFNALNESGTRLALEIPGGLPDISADTDAIEQVLLNLLSNAARHTEKGVITMSLSAGSGFQTVRVSDDGEGMAPEVREQVFLRYIERESRITGRSGMGLFICKKLIDAHGGEIGIESEPGKGTAVWFRLPDRETEGKRT
jgi:signal transduction histidine kinase